MKMDKNGASVNGVSETAVEVDATLTAKELLGLCLSRWYWFVISLALCCGAAMY